MLADRIGGRRTGIIGMALTLVALLLGWQFAHTRRTSLRLGLLLGIAGASFAVALPLASRWYPPEYQGLAMGIAGAGNSGTLLATLFAPRLAERFGWAATFGLAMLPLAGRVRGLRAAWPRTARRRAPPHVARATTAPCCASPTRCGSSFLYSLTFGGFVGLRQFPDDVLPRAVPAVARVGGRLHDARRGRRQLPAPGRRLAVRPRRRLSAAGAACWRRSPSASASSRRCRRCAWPSRVLFVGMGAAGDGQRRGVPAGAAALSRSDRPRHRHRRRGRRARRLLPADAARRDARTSTGQLHAWAWLLVAALFVRRHLRAARARRPLVARGGAPAAVRTGRASISYRATLTPRAVSG